VRGLVTKPEAKEIDIFGRLFVVWGLAIKPKAKEIDI